MSLAETVADRRTTLSTGLGLAALASLPGCALPSFGRALEATSGVEDPMATETRKQVHYKSGELVLPTQPFLHIPFSKNTKIAIGQGWVPNPDQKQISKIKIHDAVDFKVPFGTPIYSPCDGLLVASIQARWRFDPESGEQVTFQGQRISFGPGLFVEIARQNGQRVQIYHLGSLNPQLNEAGYTVFHRPTRGTGGNLDPAGYNLTFEEMTQRQVGIPIKAGQQIGTVGFSGLCIGHIGIIYNGEDWPNPQNPEELTTWDPIGPHAHIEVAFRKSLDRAKYAFRDPLSGYTNAANYHDEKGILIHRKDSLVHFDPKGHPLFAA